MELSKDERIEKEKRRLAGVFASLETKTKKAVQSLIDNAAFMAVTLRGLQETMNVNGVVSEYQNGENQWGTKKSPEVEIYNTMVKNHASIIKQLTDLLPAGSPKQEGDGFDEFVSKR